MFTLDLVTREEHEFWFLKAVEVARMASCLRSRCGCVIVKRGKVLGEGFNSPAGGIKGGRRCKVSKEKYDLKVTDKTCCVHAEQRAIMDALRRNSRKLVGSTLYFIRLDCSGRISYAGKPYCTICSKMALDTGVKEFVLWHEKGIVVYGMDEYNELSFRYSRN